MVKSTNKPKNVFFYIVVIIGILLIVLFTSNYQNIITNFISGQDIPIGHDYPPIPTGGFPFPNDMYNPISNNYVYVYMPYGWNGTLALTHFKAEFYNQLTNGIIYLDSPYGSIPMNNLVIDELSSSTITAYQTTLYYEQMGIMPYP